VRNTKWVKNSKLPRAILSAFYNISQRNFGILLILWCSFKLWWNFCLDPNLVYNANGPFYPFLLDSVQLIYATLKLHSFLFCSIYFSPIFTTSHPFKISIQLADDINDSTCRFHWIVFYFINFIPLCSVPILSIIFYLFYSILFWSCFAIYAINFFLSRFIPFYSIPLSYSVSFYSILVDSNILFCYMSTFHYISVHTYFIIGVHSTTATAGRHYQSFCDHSRNFTSGNATFWRICKKCLMKLTPVF
jgi:hypothetical protein